MFFLKSRLKKTTNSYRFKRSTFSLKHKPNSQVSNPKSAQTRAYCSSFQIRPNFSKYSHIFFVQSNHLKRTKKII
ncbi:hypothetical protein CKA32_005178 [Geitlerinema sp. FC II]|nr:hypothetical protein CKA32_005178 [Geitlerinema sp. FC II]